MEYLREHQLNIMLILIGICGIIAFFVLLTKTMNRRRKISLLLLEMGSFLLLVFDRFAYIYRGDLSTLGYWMVRISNFMVYFMLLFTLMAFNVYLADLFRHEGGLPKTPKRLMVAHVTFLIGIILLIIAQFTGLYYTFDESNRYQRTDGFLICYILPIIALALQLSVIVQYGRRLTMTVSLSLLLFSSIPIIASIMQVFMYGLSLTNISIVAMCILLYVFALIDMNDKAEKSHRQEVDYLREQQENMSRLFEQTATALVGAIDEGKAHSKGHSVRVARYARELARLSGKSSAECEEVYFAALLHDVGKVRIPEEILAKTGELSEEEEKVFETHTEIGVDILKGIENYPFLSTGARYHHERYDGKGYPEAKKGENIPEVARIIAVADAYDDMTSRKKYRDPLPQVRVREEFVKESGLRFDPKYSKVMLQVIDSDPEYRLKENDEDIENIVKSELDCREYRSDISSGILVSRHLTRVKFKSKPYKEGPEGYYVPALILFDSLDACVHATEQAIRENGYTEYGEIWFDGHSVCTRARNIESNILEEKKEETEHGTKERSYELELGRYRDHLKIVLKDGNRTVETIAVLPDSTRYTYVALTGEQCSITNIVIEELGRKLEEGDIPRIADEIVYTNRLESDLKNVQIDSKRSATTEGVKLNDRLRLDFHTMSLPTAHLVWHCPYVILYTSDNGQVLGPNYREFVLVRLDGEIEENDDQIENKMLVTKSEAFDNWDSWKKLNQKGMECSVEVRRKGNNKVTIFTENAGVSIKNTTILDTGYDDIYVALTGDQCALTDIRVM